MAKKGWGGKKDRKDTRGRTRHCLQKVGVLAEVCRGDLSVHVVILHRLVSRSSSKTKGVCVRLCV